MNKQTVEHAIAELSITSTTFAHSHGIRGRLQQILHRLLPSLLNFRRSCLDYRQEQTSQTYWPNWKPKVTVKRAKKGTECDREQIREQYG
jgi:hypothetical protein